MPLAKLNGAAAPHPTVDLMGTPDVATAIAEHSKSMDGVALSLSRIAEAIEASTKQREPVDEFYSAATDTLACVRRKVAKWGPWILASAPGVLVAINALSPAAAAKVKAVMIALGLS